MSKIKKKADAKKIADSIAKAKEKFPDLCKEGQKIQVAMMDRCTFVEVEKFMEAGVEAQVEKHGKNAKSSGYIDYLTIGDSGELTVASIQVDIA